LKESDEHRFLALKCTAQIFGGLDGGLLDLEWVRWFIFSLGCHQKPTVMNVHQRPLIIRPLSRRRRTVFGNARMLLLLVPLRLPTAPVSRRFGLCASFESVLLTPTKDTEQISSTADPIQTLQVDLMHNLAIFAICPWMACRFCISPFIISWNNFVSFVGRIRSLQNIAGITNDQEHAHSTLHKSNAILFENGALANEASLFSILLWFHKNFNLFNFLNTTLIFLGD